MASGNNKHRVENELSDSELCPATAAVSTITRSTCFHHASTSTTSDAASDQNTYRHLVTVLSHSLDCVHMYLSIIHSSMQCGFSHFHRHFQMWVLCHIYHKLSGSSLPCQSIKSKVPIVQNSLKAPQLLLIQWHLAPHNCMLTPVSQLWTGFPCCM